MPLDLTRADEKLNRTATLDPVLDEEQKPIPGASITVYSIDSQVYRRQIMAVQQRNMDRAMLARNRPKISAEESEEDALTTLAVCTKSWTGFEKDGSEFICNRENAIWLYRNVPNIRDQVDRLMGDRAAFLQKSLNGSRPQSEHSPS
jgi:hypothetical protein